MEYHDSEKAKEVAGRVRAFMDDVVIPREREALANGEQISTEVHLRSIAFDAFEDVPEEELEYVCRLDEDRLHDDLRE